MKKFIDGDVKLDFSSVFKFVQSAVCLILLAPYQLVDTITMRVMYLKRKQMATVLLYSVFIAVVITALNAAVMIFFGEFSLTKGKFPLVIMLAVVAVLIAFYLIFGMCDFVTYTQLDSVMSETPEAVGTEENAMEETEGNTSRTENVIPEAGKLEDEQKSDTLSTGKSEVEQKFAFCWEISGEITLGRKITEGDLTEFKKALDASEDPSEFLPEEYLAKIDAMGIIEDDANLQSLNLGVIPAKFKALA